MNKIIKYILIMIICFTTVNFMLSCQEGDKMFKFEASIVSGNNIKTYEQFDVLMKTTNITGTDIHYEGSSTVVGATIYLKSKDGRIIRPNDVPVTKDFRKMVFKNNATIERIWNFEYEKIEESGWYDLYIEFFGIKEVFADFVYVE